jgi:hypothetical protein
MLTRLMTADIAQGTRSIKDGYEKILEEIRFLQAQVASLDMQQESKLAIQKFLVESAARANSDGSGTEGKHQSCSDTNASATFLTQRIDPPSQARSRSSEDLQLPQNTSATTDSTSCSNNVPTEKAQFRTWTDQSTSFTVEAEFLCLDHGLVTLWSRKDKQISIPISKMSCQDRDYIDGVLGLASEIDRSQDPELLPPKKDATVLSGEDVGTSFQSQRISGLTSWFAFFRMCDIPVSRSMSYAETFRQNSIDDSTLTLFAGQTWASRSLLEEFPEKDRQKVMSLLLSTSCVEVRDSVRRYLDESDDTLTEQRATRWERISPLVVQQKPLKSILKNGTSSSNGEGERGRSQSAPPSRQPMPAPLPRWGEFELESNPRGRPNRRATWEDNDRRGRRSRSNSWDELDRMARSRNRSCSLPARYAGLRVSQGQTMRTRSRSVRIRSRSRSNRDIEDIEIEFSGDGWDGREVDIEIGTGCDSGEDFWCRGRGESLVDLEQDFLRRTHHRRGPYWRGDVMMREW